MRIATGLPFTMSGISLRSPTAPKAPMIRARISPPKGRHSIRPRSRPGSACRHQGSVHDKEGQASAVAKPVASAGQHSQSAIPGRGNGRDRLREALPFSARRAGASEETGQASPQRHWEARTNASSTVAQRDFCPITASNPALVRISSG